MMSKHLDHTHLQAGRQLILVAGELNHVVGRLLSIRLALLVIATCLYNDRLLLGLKGTMRGGARASEAVGPGSIPGRATEEY